MLENQTSSHNKPLLGHDIYSISQKTCTRFCCALLCCGYAIVHNEFTWCFYPYSSGLLCWHWGNRYRLPQCQGSKPDGYGKISQCVTTTKHSKAKTVCIFLGIYCILAYTCIHIWFTNCISVCTYHILNIYRRICFYLFCIGNNAYLNGCMLFYLHRILLLLASLALAYSYIYPVSSEISLKDIGKWSISYPKTKPTKNGSYVQFLEHTVT